MEGHCPCGAVQYRLKDVPLFTHACHCRACQRESGGAFAMNGMIEASAVELTCGQTVAVPVPAESGKDQIFHRCSDCMVTLWSIYGGAGPKFLFVRMGTLTDSDAFPPDVHIFTESKQPWVILPEDTPSFPQFYRRSAVWPAASLARRAAALA